MPKTEEQTTLNPIRRADREGKTLPEVGFFVFWDGEGGNPARFRPPVFPVGVFFGRDTLPSALRSAEIRL